MNMSARWIGVVLLAVGMLPTVTLAQEGGRNFNARNRLRLEYDDNIYNQETNELDSWKIIEEIDLKYNLNRENTFLSLAYRPSLIFWENRDDDTDLHHAFDAVFNHAFNPRWAFNFNDTFRIAENPDQIVDGTVQAQKGDYMYNSAQAALSYLMAEATRLEFAARAINLMYDKDEVADISDYDLYVGGLTLRHSFRPTTALLGDLRYETLSYADGMRDSETWYIGAGVEHTFTPTFLFNLRGGLQSRAFDNPDLEDKDTPYVDATITMAPGATTRLTAGLSYAQYETDIYPFASRERSKIFASLAQDITGKITGYLTAGYSMSDYDAAQSAAADQVTDGDEDFTNLGLRATYEINRSNLVEASWQYYDLSGDVRADYARNRVGLGWIVKI